VWRSVDANSATMGSLAISSGGIVRPGRKRVTIHPSVSELSSTSGAMPIDEAKWLAVISCRRLMAEQLGIVARDSQHHLFVP